MNGEHPSTSKSKKALGAQKDSTLKPSAVSAENKERLLSKAATEPAADGKTSGKNDNVSGRKV